MLTAVVLTKDEAVHIERCIRNLQKVASRIVVVDSFSTDCTQEIARSLGAEVVEHKWPGNQADQFNWALDNLEITTPWILRLDADEYLSEELIAEIKEKLLALDDNISAVVLPLGRCFMGKKLKHGIVNGIKIARIFRTGHVRYEQRLMDEHINILNGDSVEFKHKFYDDNRMPLSYFIEKHNGYADREAATMLINEYCSEKSNDNELVKAAQKKRAQKSKYARMPLFWRSFGYFAYRYILRGGFLNGKEGFLWDYLQGWWYRTLVDAKILEIKRSCDNDSLKIRDYLAQKFNLDL